MKKEKKSKGVWEKKVIPLHPDGYDFVLRNMTSHSVGEGAYSREGIQSVYTLINLLGGHVNSPRS